MNNLKSLIIQQIKSVFGSTIKVYDEEVKQGLKVPSFQFLIADNSQTTGLNVVKRNPVFNVNYFPKSLNERRTECDEVLETFQNEFRLIGGKHYAYEIEGKMSDGVLVITFGLRLLLKEVVTGTPMTTLGGVTVGFKK
ncbi:DUF6838 family protein [Sporosarcina sp. FSL K6-2383]|uniref:phage tail terminator family protein n=1 Tax=Sporosarcina sp. FSL K6-2383 TaxID=2921556 RepID=UPI00315B19EA